LNFVRLNPARDQDGRRFQDHLPALRPARRPVSMSRQADRYRALPQIMDIVGPYTLPKVLH